MEDDREAKQTYLREQILQKQYDPQEFVEFLNQKLNIGDNIDQCSLQELKSVVIQFVKTKSESFNEPGEESQSGNGPIGQISTLPSNSMIEIAKSSIQGKPKNILFQKFNIMEPQFSKTYQCIKINDKYSNYKGIKCEVYNPERKVKGGFFGIGATSFLEFQVKTTEVNWLVGRRYSDFMWLRNYLVKVYPTQIIPPVPQKKASKKTQRHVQKRMKILEYFLNDLVNIPECLNNKYVQGFLKITDGAKFEQLKDQSEKLKPFSSITSVETAEGQINIKLNDENKLYLSEMQAFVPQVQRIYKQITRQGKGLQDLYTQQVNNLYEIGNLFAQLHQKSRQILNKLPKCDGLKKMNDIYITLNNMMIEWGNIIRNQHNFLEKNFNTFFKYVRNQLHGYNEVFAKENEAQEEFAKAKIALDKKKEKIYNLFDPSKWELSKEIVSSLSKEIIHDKAEAYKIMLPKENIQLDKLRIKDFLYIDRLSFNGNKNFNRCSVKFCENFKEFAIKIKVNTQQLSQLWGQMGANFSGSGNKVQQLKQIPKNLSNGDQIVDD